ncbi:LytTR family transcriptional regulator DNA-binding domain-containing protein [Lachnospiraceae bacterium MD1]|jgi:DNA-binding LytR/AlgR family response regulator|uniref:LytTR family transcriptional regulator DNA-binding domain-containing protein n=1 Tax=Variimorphobacter saccharofermentans TaxID=2755051 RepID=A0A839K6L4_9FIRM|nr:LytTR family DNA-binding domain-containing protein [Variimorphobacter saccharofermentans]MBB2184719.1 LytTR family transcriptional regulator DNA-binding domain-containing protein [Variimorphobacter saccharofermentans]
MKIIIEDKKPGEEDHIIIRCSEMNDVLLKFIADMKLSKKKLAGIKDGKITMIDPSNIYYFEGVDNKVFLYCKQDVYETKLKLYEIEEDYKDTEFFRASKSVILNVKKIKSISPAYSGRFEALLFNGETVIISRQYVPELKRKLGLREGV